VPGDAGTAEVAPCDSPRRRRRGRVIRPGPYLSPVVRVHTGGDAAKFLRCEHPGDAAIICDEEAAPSLTISFRIM
jgi:hypothetical protein